MQDDLQEQTRSRAAAQTRRRKRRIWVAGLCCTVAAATAYALTRPALTMTQQTFSSNSWRSISGAKFSR